MAGYVDRNVDEILKYLNCNTIEEGLKKLEELEKKYSRQNGLIIDELKFKSPKRGQKW